MNKHDSVMKNLLMSNIPFCIFNGDKFIYYKNFDNFIMSSFFESYFLKKFNEIKAIKGNYKYLSIFTKDNSLKIFNLYCYNDYDCNDNYIETSFILFENIIQSENQFLNVLLPKSPQEIFYFNRGNFSSSTWETVWLFSLGFKRREISQILNINSATVNKRLHRAKVISEFDSIESFVFKLKQSGCIYHFVPKQFEKHLLIRVG